MCVPGAYRVQKRVSYALKLKLLNAVTIMQVLGMEPVSSRS